MECPHCGKLFASGPQNLEMHIKKKHLKIRGFPVEDVEDVFADAHILPEQVDADMEQDFDGICISFREFQRTILERIKEYSKDKNLGQVKMSDGTYSTGQRRTYMLILVYVSSRPQLSEEDGTSLLRLLKDVTFYTGREIALPSR
jgi:uncharacterized protein (DUF2225 family)